MTKEFIIEYTDWRGIRDSFFCCASCSKSAYNFAIWTLGDLIEIYSVEEF